MSDLLLGLVISLGVPVYIVLQIILPRGKQGGWRWAALAPLLIAVPLALFCLYALVRQSNLWPLAFVLFAPLGAGYLLALWIINRVLRAKS